MIELRFHRSLQFCTISEKRRKILRRQRFQKLSGSRSHYILRRKKRTILVALAVEITKNITQINPKQTEPSKMRIKNGPHQLELRKRKGKTSDQTLENNTN